MATATAAKPRRTRTAAPKSKVKVTPDDFLRISQFLDTEVVVERALELRVLRLGLLAGVNVHLIGPPGTAKSLTLREYARCITDCVFFEKALHAQTPADSIIGGFDMEKFVSGGGLTRKLEGYAGRAHIVFLDELPRANGPTLDSTLPIMNAEERRCEGNGGMTDAWAKFIVTASNSWFDPDNTQAQAIAARVTLICLVHDIKSDDNFKELMRRNHARRIAEKDGTWERPTITLAQLEQAQSEVMHVQLGGEYLDAFAKLRRDARGQGLNIDGRHWVELGRVSRASAWMAGRTETIPDDLASIEAGLWRDPNEIPIAAKLVQEFHGRFVREAHEKRQEAASALASVEEIRPLVEGTPVGQLLEPDTITRAVNASRAVDAVKARVDAVLEEATREKRQADELQDLSNELLGVQKWFDANDLPTGLTK